MRFAPAAYLVLFLALPGCGAAQSPQSKDAAKPDDATVRAADEYYASANYAADGQFYVELTVQRYARAIARRGGKADAQTEGLVADLIRPDFEAFIEDRHQRLVKSFAMHLSIDDLEELTTWAKTPLGIRFTTAKADILQEVYGNEASEIQDLGAAAMKKHIPDFEKLGLVSPVAKKQ